MTTSSTPEILAPGGSIESLTAALKSGADAIYFGLTTLNARRGAKNIEPAELEAVVKQIHDAGARAYLTLNIDLTDRETGQAYRIVELAKQTHVDAILIRDPALLPLVKLYPEIEFHFSTQACISSSADVEAAKALGIKRVVLARENSLEEIKTASAIEGVETEVFVQGALCFCVSGRCLLSSWGGGRSGNRGTCTSPCRVPWGIEKPPKSATPLSMHDLGAVSYVKELTEAGVSSLKIEGRLKSPAWVSKAVELYRRACAGEDAEVLKEESDQLGEYTGRRQTNGYLTGHRDKMCGLSGRVTSETKSPKKTDQPVYVPPPEKGLYNLSIDVTEKSIHCIVTWSDRKEEWDMPKTVVKKRAITLADILDELSTHSVQGLKPGQITSNDESFEVPRRIIKKVEADLSHALRQPRQQGKTVRLELPEPVKNILESTERHPDNRLALGSRPNRVRLSSTNAMPFLEKAKGVKAAIVEGLTAKGLEELLASKSTIPIIPALPSLFFEEERCTLEDLLKVAAREKLTVEVNNWGGWFLAKQAGVKFEGGPEIGIDNSLASSALKELGFSAVSFTVEGDQGLYESLSGRCALPSSLTVYGRPPLLISRSELPKIWEDRTFNDRRGIVLRLNTENGLTVFRSETPFDISHVRNHDIRVRYLVADLFASVNPLREWDQMHHKAPSHQFHFNYDRSLV